MQHFNINRTTSLFLFCAISLLSSCKKSFLEVYPKGSLIASKTNDYHLLLNTNLTLISAGEMAPVVMSDDLASTVATFTVGGLDFMQLSDQKAFKWEADLYLPSDARAEITMPIGQLYTYNKVINEVMDSKEGSDAQKKSIRAEALCGRAWTNFLLVNLYGKPYNAATAATDPGVPLITISDVTQTNYTRATVQQVYDAIIEDLTTAMPDLPTILTTRVRMYKAEAEAILGKVYMYMGQFEKALPILDAALSDLGNATIPVGLYDYNKEFAPGGSSYPVDPMFGPSLRNSSLNDKEILYIKGVATYYGYYFDGVLLAPEAMQLFQPEDLRRNFLSPAPLLNPTSPFPLGMHRGIGKARPNISVGVPEMYLLRAECKARLNDIAGAVTDLETLRKNRLPAAAAAVPAAAKTSPEKLTKFVFEERIREFALEGQRWFDMRRLSVDPVYKSTVGTTHIVYDDAGKVATTYTLKPERLTLRLPPFIMAANPGLEQNP